jgi:hypothetical protein
MKHLKRFLAELDGVKKSGNGWKARCPCPDHGGESKGDNDPSLSISIGADNKILVFCFAGCTLDDILDALGLDTQALFPQPTDMEEDTDITTRTPTPTLDPKLCHDVYSALLNSISLSDTHREHLRERGLKDEQIDHNGYRTLSFFEFRNKVVRSLREQFAERLLSVPGFVQDKDKITVIQMPNGILIPVRDLESNIAALQIRADDGDPKYKWFSRSDGSCGSPVHVPLGTEVKKKGVRITEGALKADIAFAIDGIPTLGIAGVTNWKSALPVLTNLDIKTVRLAFDADVQTKKGVAVALKEFVTALRPTYEVQIDTWPLEQAKGLDDLLLASHKPTKLMGEKVTAFLENLPPCQIEEVTVEREQAPLDIPALSSEPTKQTVVEADSEQPYSSRGPDKFTYGAGEPVPFPLDFFPEPLQEVAREISDAVDSPVDFPACAMVAVGATAIGKSRQIEPKEDWELAPRIYLGLVGNPGSGKTPAVKKVMNPLWQKNREWSEEYKEKKEVYELDKSIYEVKHKEFLKHVSKNAAEAKTRSHEEE